MTSHETAMIRAVDWFTVRGIATGTITVLPERDPNTGRARYNDDGSPRTIPARDTHVWHIGTLTRWRGFDWSAFDPAQPESFLTDPLCRRILHAAFNLPLGDALLPAAAFAAFPRLPYGAVVVDHEDALRNG